MDNSNLDSLAYYCAFIVLALQGINGISVFVYGMVRLVRFDQEQSKLKETYLSIFTKVIHGLITLSIAFILLYILRSNTLSPWIPLILGVLIMGLEVLMSHDRGETAPVK